MHTTDRERLTATGATTVTWSTSDKNVAEVSDDGIVKATGAGTAVITVLAGSKSAKCDVTVEASVILAGYSGTTDSELYLWKNGKRWIPANNIPEFLGNLRMYLRRRCIPFGVRLYEWLPPGILDETHRTLAG